MMCSLFRFCRSQSRQGAPSDDRVQFDPVLNDELAYVTVRRGGSLAQAERLFGAFGQLTAADQKQRDEISRTVVGLSLSGGGIRSATTCLGILQALAQMKLLAHVDYLC